MTNWQWKEDLRKGRMEELTSSMVLAVTVAAAGATPPLSRFGLHICRLERGSVTLAVSAISVTVTTTVRGGHFFKFEGFRVCFCSCSSRKMKQRKTIWIMKMNLQLQFANLQRTFAEWIRKSRKMWLQFRECRVVRFFFLI